MSCFAPKPTVDISEKQPTNRGVAPHLFRGSYERPIIPVPNNCQFSFQLRCPISVLIVCKSAPIAVPNSLIFCPIKFPKQVTAIPEPGFCLVCAREIFVFHIRLNIFASRSSNKSKILCPVRRNKNKNSSVASSFTYFYFCTSSLLKFLIRNRALMNTRSFIILDLHSASFLGLMFDQE